MTLTFANIFFHRRALRRARRLVLVDKAKYDAVWMEVQASTAERQRIEALQNWIIYLGRFFKLSGFGRQLNRSRSIKSENHRMSLTLSGLSGISASIATSRRTSSVDGSHETMITPNKQGWENLLDCGLPSIADPMHPVNSLDQLYFQATALNPILIAKVQAWASVSGGCFMAVGNYEAREFSSSSIFGSLSSIRNSDSKNSLNPVESYPVGTLPPGYVRWVEVRETELHQGGKVKWCKIKSVQRSIEKSTRSYGKVSLDMSDIQLR